VALLRSVGVRWCSPAGGDFGVHDRLGWVPFEWELVDAYHLMESFSSLRVRRGDSREPVQAGALAARFAREVRAVARGGGPATLILHPFLMLDPAWQRAAGELLSEIGAMRHRGELWVGPGGALAVRGCGELPA
jgi:hypothetical protein